MATVSLQADLSVIGIPKIEAALANLQSKFKALNKAAEPTRSAGKKSLEATKAKAESAAASMALREENKRHTIAMRNAQKEAAEKMRGEKKWQNFVANENRKAFRQQEMARKKAEAGAAREAKSRAAATNRFNSGLVSGAGSKVGGVLKGLAGGLIAGTTGIAAMGVANRIQTGTKATQLAIVGKQGGDTRSIKDIRNDIMGSADKTASKFGIGTEETVGFLSSFQGKAGKLLQGQNQDKLLGQILPEGLKTGADTNTLGSIAGQIFKSFEGEGDDKALEKARIATRFFAKSAAAGSIELPDIAAELPKLISTASQTGDFETNLKNAVAIAQFSNVEGGGAANAAEAGTAVQRLGSDVIGNQKKFKAMGINALDEKGNLTNLQDLILQTLDKTGGDVTKLNELFGERSIKAVSNPAKAYRDKMQEAKAAGKTDEQAKKIALEAVKTQFAGITNVKTDQEEADKETAAYVEDESIKVAKAMRDLEIAFAKDLVPVLINDLMPAFMELAPHLKSAVKLFAQIASWAGQNPLYAVGAAITAAAVSSMAQAAIGSAISTSITSAIASAGLAAVIGGAIAAAAAGAVGYAVGKIIAPFTVGKAFDATKQTDETITKTNAALGKGTSIEGKKAALDDLIRIKSELEAGTVSEAVEYGAGMLAGDEEGVKKQQAARRKNVEDNIRVLKDQITTAAVEEDKTRLTTPKTETTTESVGKVNELGNAAQEATTKLKALAGSATTLPASARPVK